MEFIAALSLSGSAEILTELLKEQPHLVDKVYDIALGFTCDVDSDAIMNDVYYSLNALDVDDLYSRSGKTRYGCTEPSEEAWEMFEEALQPYINEMTKNQKRGLASAAKIFCIGIIKGLVKYENDSSSEFKDWATDAPFEYVDRVVDEFKKGTTNEADKDEVASISEALRYGDY